MRSILTFCLVLFTLSFNTDFVTAQDKARAEYDVVYIGEPLPDALMQRNKETFVVYGCAYCHGIDLEPVGEAPDLRTSAIVAIDVDGNVMGPLLRQGIPMTAKSSPMPQFSDLSDREITALASFIHYERAEARLRDLTNEPSFDGDADAGNFYFGQNCASCHMGEKGLAGIGSKYDDVELRKMVLKPASFADPVSYKLEDRNNALITAGRAKHQVLLENYIEPNVKNVVAYLKSLGK